MPANWPGIAGLGGVDRATLGIPSEDDYIKQYCEHRGITHIPHWRFYLAFNFFRFAAIAQGVAKRAKEGNASSKRAAQAAQVVEPLAQAALEIINESNAFITTNRGMIMSTTLFDLSGKIA